MLKKVVEMHGDKFSLKTIEILIFWQPRKVNFFAMWRMPKIIWQTVQFLYKPLNCIFVPVLVPVFEITMIFLIQKLYETEWDSLNDT